MASLKTKRREMQVMGTRRHRRPTVPPYYRHYLPFLFFLSFLPAQLVVHHNRSPRLLPPPRPLSQLLLVQALPLPLGEARVLLRIVSLLLLGSLRSHLAPTSTGIPPICIPSISTSGTWAMEAGLLAFHRLVQASPTAPAQV